MDIEELIEQLLKEAYGSDTKQLLLDAETALSDLYVKYKARDEMVNTLEDEVYRLMQEIEKLRKELEDHGYEQTNA